MNFQTKSRATSTVLLLLGTILASEARAHFLFIKIGPMAEAGRSAEVYFSEQAEAGDPKFVDKITGTELWLQARPGKFERLAALKGNDRLRANVPTSGTLCVVGTCEYGVLARPNQTPFLLRYYPKAVAGNPDELNGFSSLQTAHVPGSQPVQLEIVPKFSAEKVTLIAIRDGKPIPGLVFTTVDSDLSNTEVKAGPDGTATWKPEKPGRYSIYVKDVVKRQGDHNGKHYDEIREFATLALQWPLDRKDADTEAVSLFEKALATRANWTDFPGFSASVSGEIEGRAYTGNVTVSAEGTVKAEVDDSIARPWVEDQLASIAMHRLPENDRGSSADRPRPVLRFADEQTEHPLGRLLTFQGGRFASSYRVKDEQISVVNRHIGKQNMTITVLDNTRNADGKYLPHSYLVHYWDASTGALNRVETIQERWTRIGKLDLPQSHMVTTTSSTGLSTRSLVLSNSVLLKR